MNSKYLIYIAWAQAWIATIGSLFFSEIMQFPPCKLCWYQRICMYPLVILITIGIVKKNKDIYQYVLPFSVIGLVIAIYHNLLYYNIIPESSISCIKGVSCTTKYISWFGFITIPFLSFVAFLVITVCMLLFRRLQKNRQKITL
jgi:disulfide bond formation protein DsbB